MTSSSRKTSAEPASAFGPIQFQKQIRLQEARLLLAAHPHDVTGVAHRVGYDSPSQFSREYRREFGAPPSRDAARLHSLDQRPRDETVGASSVPRPASV